MREVHHADEAAQLLEGTEPLGELVFHGIDLRPCEPRLRAHDVGGAVFLGCKLSPEVIADVVVRGALVFPRIEGLPYDPYRNRLYTPDELFEGFDPADPFSGRFFGVVLFVSRWAGVSAGDSLESRRQEDHHSPHRSHHADPDRDREEE